MLNIVYFGTSEFAKEILKSLNESGFNITCVVTREDAKKDRGHKILPPPVKEYAVSENLTVVQPHTLKDNTEFEEYFKSLSPDVVCVAAYGKILPNYILSYPKYGAINVHGSLLPKYRGAAPIQRAIMAGEPKLGITIMQMDEGLDTGDMIANASFELRDEDNYKTACEKLAHLGSRLLIDVLNNLKTPKYQREKQDDSLSSYANKITSEDEFINFNESAVICFNRIRALYPDNCAYCFLNGQKLKITQASVSKVMTNNTPGTIYSLSNKGEGWIEVNTSEYVLRITKLIPQGKNEMSAGDFIRGRKICESDILNKDCE